MQNRGGLGQTEMEKKNKRRKFRLSYNIGKKQNEEAQS